MDSLYIPLTDGKWKIAVIVHPRKIVGCQERVLAQIKALLDANPLKNALSPYILGRSRIVSSRGCCR